MRPIPYIIFGPPGTGKIYMRDYFLFASWFFVSLVSDDAALSTGKTTTIVEAVYQLARHKDDLRILLVAPSNDAADILVERLSSYFPPSELCRILAYSRSIDACPIAIRDNAAEKATCEEQLQLILSSRIVVATVNYAAQFCYIGVPVGHFDVLCVDEARHATEPEIVSVAATLLNCVQGIPRTGQLILGGDPISSVLLLVPTFAGILVSYMERLMSRDVYGQTDGEYPADILTKLVRNYRSHPSILKLPNGLFYNNELMCCSNPMASYGMAKWEHLPVKFRCSFTQSKATTCAKEIARIGSILRKPCRSSSTCRFL